MDIYTLQFQNVHKGLKELSCKHCDKKYYAELALISHLKSAHNVFQDLQHVKKVHEGSKEFSIKKVHEVSKEFSPKQQGRAHPPDSRLQTLTCKHCAKNFSTQLYFDKHMKTCLKNKKTDKNVALVRKSHNNFVVVLGYTKSKTCDDVDKKIISEIGPEMMTVIKNQEGQRNYKCDSCGKSFTQSGDLNKHIKTLHEGQKNYKCDSCGKSFAQSGNLKIHIKTLHEGQRNFKCDSCGKSFTGSESLKKHIKTLHEGQSNYKCDFCRKSFTQIRISQESHQDNP